MPDPDLVCVMFGANDAKERDFRPDATTPALFAQRIGTLIERLRIATGGQADIALLTGVPRLDEAHLASTGAVEAIASGVAQAAAQHQTAIVDTLAAYLALDPQARKPLYVDTVHQSEAGQRFIGDRLYEAMLRSP